jgi:DNA-binding LytR/AlgR family response regulator
MLVDDEPGATRELIKGLSDFREIEVIAQFNDPVQAVKEIIKAPPDVLFLDVQMPGMTGFDVVEFLDHAGVHPVVIFITGFDKYAIEAIRHAAFDYLLKPVEKNELSRVVNRLIHTPVETDNREMFKTLLEKVNPKKRIKLSTSGGFVLLNTSDILYVEADWNYSDIYFDETTKHMVTVNIGALEKMLPESDFCRISRSIIVNMNYLTRVNRLKRLACLKKDGKEYSFKIPLLNIRKLEARLE